MIADLVFTATAGQVISELARRAMTQHVPASGAQSVRGYDYLSLGVKDGDATVGGRYLATASAEYVHWFKPQWGTAVFVDAGDAADSGADFDLRVGYGVGARWRSPAGPLAIDLAWGHQERSLRLHFGVAIAF